MSPTTLRPAPPRRPVQRSWDPNLLFRTPDWLREKRRYDAPPGIVWIAVVTFLQVMADVPIAINVRDGYGQRN